MYFVKIVLIILSSSVALHGQTTAVVQGHSHNDYKQDEPLYKALELAYRSIEVDVFWHRGAIRVAHTRLGLPFAPSFEELYLFPLLDRLKKSSEVYSRSETPIVLMIDLKRDHQLLCQELEKIFLPYKHLLCRYEDGKFIKAALQLVLSGGPPMDYLLRQEYGFLFADQPIREDGQYKTDNPFVSRRSAAWSSFFDWNGKGSFSAAERALLVNLAAGVHEMDQKIRFWAIPQTEACWKLLLDNGVDWINVDDLETFRSFYLDYQRASIE